MYGFHFPGRMPDKVVNEMNELGATVGQIFIRSPRIKDGPITKYSTYQLNALSLAIKKKKYKIFTHGTYGISLVYKNIDNKSISSLVKEAKFIDGVGAMGTVFHLGSSSKYSYEITWNKLCKNIIGHLIRLKKILKGKKYKFYLENQAKAGKKVMTTVDEMIILHKHLKEYDLLGNFGFCFDTCHDYISSHLEGVILGSERKKVDDNLKRLIKAVGVENVGIVHLNDSASDTRDVHADLLDGNIPPEELMNVIKICTEKDIPMLIERYKATKEEKEKMIKVIKSVDV